MYMKQKYKASAVNALMIYLTQWYPCLQTNYSASLNITLFTVEQG